MAAFDQTAADIAVERDNGGDDATDPGGEPLRQGILSAQNLRERHRATGAHASHDQARGLGNTDQPEVPHSAEDHLGVIKRDSPSIMAPPCGPALTVALVAFAP
jgi:hypothetical protein